MSKLKPVSGGPINGPEKMSKTEIVQDEFNQRMLDETRMLEGKILTLVDASVEPESKNKAMKDIIKKEMNGYINQRYKVIKGVFTHISKHLGEKNAYYDETYSWLSNYSPLK